MNANTPVPSEFPSVNALQNYLRSAPIFGYALQFSLVAARHSGHANLNEQLREALNKLYSGNGWPTSGKDYIAYLNLFGQVIPSENTDTTYDPWENTTTQNGYSQEVFDRLCHFYFLVDQRIDAAIIEKNLPEVLHTAEIFALIQRFDGKNLQDWVHGDFSFADWLRSYAKDWGQYLNTTDSLPPATLQSFKDDPEYNWQDYSDDEPNWLSFNDFFDRRLNATKPDGNPMRPIADPDDNTTICSPADCTYKQYYQIDSNGDVIDLDGKKVAVRLKQTHVIGNIADLLASQDLANDFKGGAFVHYFLSPFDYHRFHTPVSGTVTHVDAPVGKVYLRVTVSNGQFDAPDSAEDHYEFSQARGVLIIDTKNGEVGKVATIPVGMAQVSSVHMEALLNTEVPKGEEFGHFAFGGSDIIMLFQKPVSALQFITTAPGKANGDDSPPCHFKYGEQSVLVKTGR